MKTKKKINNIPVKVFEEYELIKQSGLCNMFDINCIKKVAMELELNNLLKYMSDYVNILKSYNIWKNSNN